MALKESPFRFLKPTQMFPAINKFSLWLVDIGCSSTSKMIKFVGHYKYFLHHKAAIFILNKHY